MQQIREKEGIPLNNQVEADLQELAAKLGLSL
jgi:hypothetical protein